MAVGGGGFEGMIMKWDGWGGAGYEDDATTWPITIIIIHLGDRKVVKHLHKLLPPPLRLFILHHPLLILPPQPSSFHRPLTTSSSFPVFSRLVSSEMVFGARDAGGGRGMVNFEGEWDGWWVSGGWSVEAGEEGWLNNG